MLPATAGGSLRPLQSSMHPLLRCALPLALSPAGGPVRSRVTRTRLPNAFSDGLRPLAAREGLKNLRARARRRAADDDHTTGARPLPGVTPFASGDGLQQVARQGLAIGLHADAIHVLRVRGQHRVT